MLAFNNKIEKFKSFFTIGLSPSKLAFTISLGILAGLFPVIGFTSILCLILGLIFRLNIIILQVTNWLVAPFQFMLIVPFYQTGAYIFGSKQSESDLNMLKNILEISIAKSLNAVIHLELIAISGWAVACIPLAGFSFLIVRHFSEKSIQKQIEKIY